MPVFGHRGALRATRRFAAAAALALGTPALAQPAPSGDADWVAAWTTAVQDPLPAGFAVGNPPPDSPQWAKTFPGNQASDQTFRLILRPAAGGDQVRLRFSNATGSKPVTFDALGIARRASGRAIVAGSRAKVTFGGLDRVTIAPGRDALSDPVPFALPVDEDVAVSFHVVGDSGPVTWHAKAMTTSYLSAAGAGDRTADDSGADLAYELRSWVWLDELQAHKAGSDRSTVVAIGDSITDGSGTTIDGNDRWEDALNRRLRAAGSRTAVVNAGIGGNRVTTLRWGPVLTMAFNTPAKLHDMSGAPDTPDARCTGCGEPAVARLERDVFSHPNVSAVIVFEGVNDLGAGGSYGDVVAGLQDIALRAHVRGIKVFAATITPYYGFAYDQVYPDLTRRQINDWIKSSKVFDGVFDFDAAVRDPSYPSQIKPGLNAPDHIHLNPKGYQAAADAIPLGALDPRLPAGADAPK